MALPSSSGFWTNRKGIYERAIVRHRNHENDFRQRWSETADYFQKNNNAAAKQQAWSSEKTYQDSMDAYKKSCERDLKAMKLKRRQEKLRELFLEESRSLEAELKGMSRQNYDRVEAMKERAEGLRSAREEKRKRIAEEKLYDHWQQNNPDIRQVQSELLKDHVIDQWSHQIEEAEMKEEKKLREEKELRDHLKKQMLELKQREEEAEELKYQQEILLRDQWEMERLEAERREKEEQRKRMDLGRALLHQHKAQMMRKSRRIQEELEQDRQLLEMMIEKEKEEISLQTARREKAQVIEDQLRVEKAREAELDTLFQDEAARMWLKREGEWERERMARQRLMDEVLEGRQEQINAKLEEVQLRQQESLERREQLLQEIEIANQLTRREQEKAKAEQEALKHNLKEQETDRMRKRGYTPRLTMSHLYPPFLSLQLAGKKQAWM
ncbi:hypothetical protein BaRGS_00002731 [Batillaria attramentaria]|uniref:Trichoplein keratin filament-binding protein n=1 Tax=Batillaria attramentaria TaxID=370345 RepID=A0ABD0M2H6_9CAEN